jgi:hypothetical protein
MGGIACNLPLAGRAIYCVFFSFQPYMGINLLQCMLGLHGIVKHSAAFNVGNGF